MFATNPSAGGLGAAELWAVKLWIRETADHVLQPSLYWKQKIAALLEIIAEVRAEIINSRHSEADGWERVKKNPARFRLRKEAPVKVFKYIPRAHNSIK
ncbi:uncharacterized protein N7473_000566 [Penicillium subrubescens]|uniref:Uncharacterized protein n=1 Tax=Penicillium subrubescens TaxID=1316194 RepID=A0A1Q5U7Y4_9EURO|nr:uncharacterized protein N7473_000566 [Penicillium subrubescens]KAJ5911263.1 hypothetical protein N7473_000566 [Penicillium subrubescens]OKP08571.1 hypothetical protein PENSUB_5558 [Penicillium subrubescens]